MKIHSSLRSSPHVDRGRRNLAANTITLMRHIGMSAFQTVLLPGLLPEQIEELNHLHLSELADGQLSVRDEIERVLSVSEPVISTSDRRIHLVGDIFEVMLNLRQWNQELSSPRVNRSGSVAR